MKKTLVKALALVLCALLVLCACAPKQEVPSSSSQGGGAQSGGEDARPRRTIPYSDMKYERPDADAMIEQIDALTDKLKAAEDFDTVLALEEELDTVSEAFYTPYVLAYIGQYHDVTDTFYEEEMRYLTDQEVEIDQHLNKFTEELTEGPFADEYRAEVGDELFEGMQLSLLLTNDSVKEYQKERNQLNQDYNQMMATLTVSAEGEDYTLSDIQSVDSLGLYYHLYDRYMTQYMEDYAQVYYKMVQLDKQTAYELGFADAATMHYLTYSRDYTPADAKALFSAIQQQLVPLVPDAYYDAGDVDYKTAMQAMPQALAAFGPEFTECWDYMVEYGLYDCEGSRDKLPGIGFTHYLYAYDAPFIFTNYQGDFGSANTIIHEFGHFYDNWLHYDDAVLFNLDIAETYSQGMELLMQEQYNLFTSEPAQARKEVLQDTLEGAIIWQSVLEDFQLRAYELETFDGTMLGRLFAQVMEDYGYDTYYYYDESGAISDWLMYATIFDSPFYTISYVTSATSALQIWAQSQTDWDAAVQTYQTMIHADQNQPYTQLLAQAGLKAPSQPGVIEEIAALFQAEFAGDAAASEPEMPKDNLPQAA